ncbi:copper resistance D family protein [Falsiroseomonas tokyonensis]|uniref:Copper resistance D family protein n=1 Tax=Falsiroseomonas tokyonensis TaxID=430521 RepID=A0ABV7C4C9_9PROT|nr:CopD family protein [Falsiroseomonas tokyonensis]MBU8541719.1 CopD family protein [Falsiroseomonas tokyonensis]OYW66553.1 MAG: hypothetical protein B7Z40_11145 [Bosea sp. 12-68-7]
MPITELLRATWYVAALGGAGLAFFFAFFVRDLAAGDSARLRRWRVLAFALGSAAAVALLTLNVSDLAGGSTILDGELWEITLGSRVGMAYGVGLIGLALGMAAARGVAIVGGVLACASFTLLGHTPVAGSWPLPSALLLVHLLVGAFWIGSLPPLTWAARRGGERDTALLRDWSRAAAWAVPLMLAAGVVLAWLLTGSVANLVGTRYGVVLLAKATLTSGMLALAAWHLWRLTPALETRKRGAGPRLARSITFEALIALAVLFAAAVLVSMPPRIVGA